jgi:hypothetical protein
MRGSATAEGRTIVIFVVALLAVVAGVTLGGQGAGSRQEAVNRPNAQPNPYRTTENWVQLPPGMDWAQGTLQQ